MQWAAATTGAAGEGTEPGEKIFSEFLPGRGLSKVITVDRSGHVTEHWQTRDAAAARRLAAFVAARAPAGERVKVRRTLHLVSTIEVDEDVPPPEAA